MTDTVDASIAPGGILEVLSRREVSQLLDSGQGGLYPLLRRCCLAVLNCGNETDDTREVLAAHRRFEVDLVRSDRGIKLELRNAPAAAFVDGVMVQGIREHLFAVLRDLVYSNDEIMASGRFRLDKGPDITEAVFHILRNADALRPMREPDLVVCWGGHAIPRNEYEYTKKVGYELGLRGLNVCTGCGPGAMKGPMKGAAVGHAKQRIGTGRFIGVTEPGIIAAEAPNPMVNELVIMPDIEKRLEAFVRLGHAIVVFPGGVGTTEEVLYLLGVLLAEQNADLPLPLVLSGPASARPYFEQIDRFVGATLGTAARQRYRIIIDDPIAVAATVRAGLGEVLAFRSERKDAFYFNWLLHVDPVFQLPFVPTHEAMASLPINRDLPVDMLAANLRRIFSGIVAGNVKEDGMRAIETHGRFEIRGEPAIMAELDQLLGAFARDGRMKLNGRPYEPVYRIAA